MWGEENSQTHDLHYLAKAMSVSTKFAFLTVGVLVSPSPLEVENSLEIQILYISFNKPLYVTPTIHGGVGSLSSQV